MEFPVHPLNKFALLFNLQIYRREKIPPEFKRQYKHHLAYLKQTSDNVFEDLQYNADDHPVSWVDFECAFAASNIAKNNTVSILDIGSYRHFILGLQATHKVTTLDVRNRKPATGNEIVITCDAKNLEIPNDSFDLIVSLCSLEHFGLGRYGDAFDLDADKKAFNEMIRVLKPGGRLIFTTTINRGSPSIVFNAHRIYNYEMIRAFCDGLKCFEENFFSHKMGSNCSLEQVTNLPNTWDVYCGCWIKRIS
jgi:SAM-dependent methyltransferase